MIVNWSVVLLLLHILLTKYFFKSRQISNSIMNVHFSTNSTTLTLRKTLITLKAWCSFHTIQKIRILWYNIWDIWHHMSYILLIADWYDDWCLWYDRLQRIIHGVMISKPNFSRHPNVNKSKSVLNWFKILENFDFRSLT